MSFCFVMENKKILEQIDAQVFFSYLAISKG